MSAVVTPSGECLRGEGLIGAVVCLLAAVAGPIVRYRVQWMAALALQHHWLSCRSTATFDDCKARLVSFEMKRLF